MRYILVYFFVFINPCRTEFNFRNENGWDIAGYWNPSCDMDKDLCILSCIKNMAADDLAMQGARASAAMVLT